MSYDTHRTYAFHHQGKKLRLYHIARNSGRVVDAQGRVGGGVSDSLVYPNETITNGLRIEYTAIVKPFVQQDPETTSYSSLTEVTSPKETTHVNLNRMLSLAIVDFVKAALAERQGDIQLKEYYMKEFFSKIADNESNKNKVYIAHPIDTFAVK
ncbi:hypothetical protein CMI47_00140 [Candidatus Pacearchaeota archaeon]|jgi:hypothetical protein|nr:hypothetical protein [Candidatus Pacearchaeota archaeon]|tara:strand:- start:210 stop:671 length:462 start_codon:yes stop_codon:yes gene_type:complete